jgi:hypothetical protein
MTHTNMCHGCFEVTAGSKGEEIVIGLPNMSRIFDSSIRMAETSFSGWQR